MREAGQRVRPNLSRFTVASIIRTYRQENRTARRPAVGGRQRVFTHAQELAVVNLVVANNAITLRQLRERILEDQAIFHNVHSVSTTTLARVLREHHVSMKQLYKVPFERNSVAVKNLRYDYVQTVLAFDAAAQQHEYIYIDEAGFNLAKTRRRGRKGHREHPRAARGQHHHVCRHWWSRAPPSPCHPRTLQHCTPTGISRCTTCCGHTGQTRAAHVCCHLG
ncbi:uncharacterized protein LOC114829605 [Esox lucius]|uniref:uncharacterized protein LOC114829605 n=1 Tax=Esox lucius TaxID=8010 RepID=UPI0010BDF354|nr:uncharacterized protein LOC114829605 [Esox lucius]